jgi:hypothetical protein
MTVHQCPKCELRFSWQTELDEHCRTDHPQFHHDYPVHRARGNARREPAQPPPAKR